MTTGPRSGKTKIYTAVAVIGGVAALFVLGSTLTSPDPSALDVLLWAALALLLLAAAAHEWWFAGRTKDRSRDVAAEIGETEVDEALQGSANEVEAIRRLREAHPELRLRDAHRLVERRRRADR